MSTISTPRADFAKQRIALRYWLYGAGYARAADAMAWAEGYHQGTRKDNVTPEFAHQVAIASHVRTFCANLRFPEDTIITAFCHDMREDYGVSDEEIRGLFGTRVGDAVDALTKEYRGEKRDPVAVFAAIASDPIASVVKLADRIHNHSSMVGVFSGEKMSDYTKETLEHFLGMLKKARRAFSDQEPVHEALGLVLATQLELVEALVQALSRD